MEYLAKTFTNSGIKLKDAHLFFAELLLVLLQPSLVVLDEKVDGVALGQEGGPGRQG